MNQLIKSNIKGSTLLIVLANVVIMALILAAASSISSHSRVQMVRANESLQTTMIADASIQRMYGLMNRILAQPNNLPNNVTFTALYNTFNTNNAPYDLTPDSNYRFLNYTVIPIASDGSFSQLPSKEVVDGKQFRFLAVCWVQSLRNPNIISKIQQEMQFTFKPLFQYAVFYNPNMEIFNGPEMVLSGKVHSNGGIYLFNSGVLTFNSDVSAVTQDMPAWTGIPGSRGQTRTTSSNLVNYNKTVTRALDPKKLPGMVTEYDPILTNNPNFSTNGAIQLIKRPVLGNIGGTNYTMRGSDPDHVEATDDPYAPTEGISANDESQVNVRMFYKADLRIIIDTNRQPKFYTGEVSDANPNGTPIDWYIPDTNGNPIITKIQNVSGVMVTNYLTNQTWAALNSSLVTSNRISDFRWSGNRVSNNVTLGVTNVLTSQLNVSNLLDVSGNLRTEISSYKAQTTTNLLAGTTPFMTNTTPITNFNGIVYISNDRTFLTNTTTTTNRTYTTNVTSITSTPKLKNGKTNGWTYTTNFAYTTNTTYNSTTTTEGSKVGVSLINGAKLPDNVISSYYSNGVEVTSLRTTNKTDVGLSIITDNSLYIIGDYNTGATGSSVPSNNSTSNDSKYNLTNSTTSTYSRLPASVMADAVTLVSSSYTSSMTNSSLNSRTPVKTTYNTAILSGFVPSSINTNNYEENFLSGGVHNFPRFLENWGNIKCVINGSIVNIFDSEQANSPFYCNVTGGATGEVPSSLVANFSAYYGAPTRVWNFDTNFEDPTKLPPGTPMVRQFTLGQWAKVQ